MGANAKTTKAKAENTTVSPAQTSVEMRAQFFRRNRPTPLNTPKIPSAIMNATVPSAIAAANGGKGVLARLIGAMSMPIRPIAAPSSTSTLPAIATIPDASTEAEGFFGTLTEVVYIIFAGFQEGYRNTAKPKVSLDASLSFRLR